MWLRHDQVRDRRRISALATTVLPPLMTIVVLVVVALAAAAYSPSGDVSPVDSLSDAVAAGDVGAARGFLAGGADPDEPRINGFTPLMRAAIRDDAPMVKLLYDAGARLDITTPSGLTPWHVAAEADAPAALQVFVDLGVDLDQRSSNGMNTLDHAADGGAVDVVSVIAETGLDLDAPSEIITQGHGYPIDIGSTALSIAVRAGHLETVERLLAAGADVDSSSELGQTPLLHAVIGRRPELVDVLLRAGADPEARAACASRCGSGESLDALGWARRRGDPEVVALLEAVMPG